MTDLQRDPPPDSAAASTPEVAPVVPQTVAEAADLLAADMDLVAGQWAAASAAGDRKWKDRRTADGGGFAAIGSDDGFGDMNRAIELGAVHRGMVRAWQLLTGRTWTGTETTR